jgi:hypothetical protein
MTDEMLALARENQVKAGVENVEWLRGEIEAIPLPDESVDVVISNCVINLSGDNPASSPRPRGSSSRAAASRLRRDRRRGHGRGHESRHAAVHGLHRRRPHLLGVRARPRRRRPGEVEIVETHRVHEHAGSAVIRAHKPGGQEAGGGRS